MNPKWEYKTLDVRGILQDSFARGADNATASAAVDHALNALGGAGWELVCNDQGCLIFKRRTDLPK